MLWLLCLTTPKKTKTKKHNEKIYKSKQVLKIIFSIQFCGINLIALVTRQILV